MFSSNKSALPHSPHTDNNVEGIHQITPRYRYLCQLSPSIVRPSGDARYTPFSACSTKSRWHLQPIIGDVIPEIRVPDKSVAPFGNLHGFFR